MARSELPLLDRDAVFERLAQAAPAAAPSMAVLCSSARLAQHLHEAYANFRLRGGAQIWATPMMLTPEQFLAQILRGPERDAASAGVLSSAESDLMWRLVVSADPQASPLLRQNEAAALAAQAWQLCHDHELGLPLPASTSDGERFNAWAAAYESRCAELGRGDAWMHRAAQVERLAGTSNELPSAVVFAGFETLVPWQETLAASLQSAGCSLFALSHPDRPARPRAVQTRTPEQELRVAAQWVLQTATRRPAARIAVVVPDLSARREDVLRVFDQVLCPQLETPGRATGVRPYNLSLGRSLADCGLVHDALLLLRLLQSGVDSAEAGALLCSPAWGSDEAERMQRAALDRRLRADGHAHVDLAVLLRGVPPDAPLHARLNAMQRLRGSRRTADPGEWAQRFDDWLAAAGWPGWRKPDSVEYQQLEAWRGVLQQFAALGEVLGRVPASAALDLLHRLAGERVFQPQTPTLPIQVLGALEAQGLDFDALWVAGLDDEHWPPAGRPNPFIPFALQRERQLPHASARQELAWAQSMTERWRSAADIVVFSWARDGGDHPLGPSPLIQAEAEHAATVEIDALAPQWRAAAAIGAIGVQADAHGVGPAAGAPVGGGARLLGDQARCPFRAFATHRLGARALETPGYGPTPIDRGVVVHQALETLWRTLGDQTALLALDDDALGRRIDAAIDDALAKLAARAGQRLPDGLRALEAECLGPLLRRWFELERRRAPFRVLQIEGGDASPDGRPADHLMQIEGLTLALRADRIDELADGRRVIIDYKTGARKPLPWHDGRPEEPQLLLYALGTSDVAGIGYGRVNARDVAFQGLSADPDLVDGFDHYAAERATAEAHSWGGLIGRWRGELQTLALEVSRGLASVTPKHVRTACADCDLHALCRIHEVGPDVDEDAGVDDDDRPRAS